MIEIADLLFIDFFLNFQGAVNIDPIKRFHEIASPDSIDAMCNIYEVYRAMLQMLGEGVTDVFVQSPLHSPIAFADIC